MPVLKTLVEAPTKTRFRALAEARGLSESELLRLVVLTVTTQSNQKPQPVAIDPDKAVLERMTLRLPKFLMDSTKNRTKAQGMTPSRGVAALVQSNLTRQPVMNDAALTSLVASSRELAAIGRNINQMTRSLNTTFHETEQIRLDTLAVLSDTIACNRTEIRALVRASQQAWETDDGSD